MFIKDPTHYSILSATFGNLADYCEAEAQTSLAGGNDKKAAELGARVPILRHHEKKARRIFSRLQSGELFDEIPEVDLPKDPQDFEPQFRIPNVTLVKCGYPPQNLRSFSIGSPPPKAKKVSTMQRIRNFMNTRVSKENNLDSARARQKEELLKKRRSTIGNVTPVPPTFEFKAPTVNHKSATPPFEVKGSDNNKSTPPTFEFKAPDNRKSAPPTFEFKAPDNHKPTSSAFEFESPVDPNVAAVVLKLKKAEWQLEYDLKPKVRAAKNGKEKRELVTNFIAKHIDSIDFDGLGKENKTALRPRRKSLVHKADRLAPQNLD